MKPLTEVHSCVIDAGTFIPLADMMGGSVARSSYYSPFEQEFLGIDRCVIGDGMERFQRVDEYMEPDFFNSVDLWIFPDIGYGGFQRYLRSLGKNVWGSMGASDLELYRTRFLKVIKDCGLPVVPSITIRGLSALAEHLQGVEDKWVKINRFRDNMETWRHIDWLHSEREIERLAKCFGPLKEHVVFVVQDAINSDGESPVLEVGYDGWSVDGWFPDKCFQGYELKNKLYLGSLLDYEKLPEGVREVNEKFSPVLEEYGYRNFWATEIRIKDDTPYFIDPTARMAGQTMEHLLDTCTNLADVIYQGAQGNIIQPEFSAPFAAEATLHYTAECDEAWKTFIVPKEIERWVKLYRCCQADGAYQFPPDKSDELGVICGAGETIKESIDSLKENFEALENEPVRIDIAEFADLLRQIQEAEEEHVEFSDQPVPDPAVVMEES